MYRFHERFGQTVKFKGERMLGDPLLVRWNLNSCSVEQYKMRIPKIMNRPINLVHNYVAILLSILIFRREVI